MLLVASLGGGLAVAGPNVNAPSHPSPVLRVVSSKGRLGFVALAISPELRAHYGAPDDRGVLVDGVRPDSPAARAGLQVGDVVAEVDGAPATSAADVIDAIGDRKKGDEVTIVAFRGGTRLELHAKLETDPARQATLGGFGGGFGGGFDLPDDLDSWLKFDGGDGDMRSAIKELQRHMRELEQRFAGPKPDHI